eukprot:Selendium_serpulae@DN4068_c0_g1_i1.p1
MTKQQAYKYIRKPLVPETTAKALGLDMRVHFKNMYETAAVVRGMRVGKARQFLQDVIDRKRCVPFRRFTGCIGRTAQAKEWKTSQGRWPIKSCKYLMDILRNAQANAKDKHLRAKEASQVNLQTDDLIISHIAVQKAAQGRRRTYRAHGRINPYKSSPCHVEVFLTPKDNEVPKATDKKEVRLTRRQMGRMKLPVGGGLKQA